MKNFIFIIGILIGLVIGFYYSSKNQIDLNLTPLDKSDVNISNNSNVESQEDLTKNEYEEKINNDIEHYKENVKIYKSFIDSAKYYTHIKDIDDKYIDGWEFGYWDFIKYYENGKYRYKERIQERALNLALGYCYDAYCTMDDICESVNADSTIAFRKYAKDLAEVIYNNVEELFIKQCSWNGLIIGTSRGLMYDFDYKIDGIYDEWQDKYEYYKFDVKDEKYHKTQDSLYNQVRFHIQTEENIDTLVVVGFVREGILRYRIRYERHICDGFHLMEHPECIKKETYTCNGVYHTIDVPDDWYFTEFKYNFYKRINPDFLDDENKPDCVIDNRKTITFQESYVIYKSNDYEE
ncbi:MAG: hypothetical protein IJ270_00950 [Paludibacteraceae bacterium]|nr:hypothetical protein [Paludibacteraceae bacterium]